MVAGAIQLYYCQLTTRSLIVWAAQSVTQAHMPCIAQQTAEGKGKNVCPEQCLGELFLFCCHRRALDKAFFPLKANREDQRVDYAIPEIQSTVIQR